MRKIFCFLSLFFILAELAYGKKHTKSFIVELKDQSIKVTSPPKKVDIVSIIVKNGTFDKIISVLKSENKVLKRFVLKAQGKEVIQVDLQKTKKLFYVPISPPSESVELKFKERPYEIPEKK